jgi:hypothetical protein
MTESQMCSMDYTRHGLSVQQIQNVNVSFVLVCKHSAKFQRRFLFYVYYLFTYTCVQHYFHMR